MMMDRLYEKVEENGHVCVGLDTDLSYIPKWFLDKHENLEDAIFNFNKKLIDATKDISACYKLQIAYYEAYGIKGLTAYMKTLKYIKENGLISIGDIKRGDISSTAKMYAKAHFEGDFESDFITLNPYMGLDSITPYIPYLESGKKGVFALLRTSNEGAKDIQYIKTAEKTNVYDEVGKGLSKLGKDLIGKTGYSAIGAVVGCTHEGQEIRKDFKDLFFLIPGYGAQGGGAKDVAPYLQNGNGGVVNSSRGILLAYRKEENGEQIFDQLARKEVLRMRADIKSGGNL